MLAALKDSKRVVELKYQNILVEKGNFDSKLLCLNQSNELMQVEKKFLISTQQISDLILGRSRTRVLRRE